MCTFESKSEVRYNNCIVVGRNETFWKKFASMICLQFTFVMCFLIVDAGDSLHF